MTNIAIVTGGGRGIGAATARLLARRGYDVAIAYLSDMDSAAAVLSDIEATGRRGLAVQCDVGLESSVENLFAAVDAELGPVSALVNNAGFAGPIDRLEDTVSENIRRVVDTNFLGAVWCCRAAVRRMSARHGGKGGAIVNITSGAATIGSPNEYIWYAAAKAAVNTLTLGLAKEAARDGIRVNAVAPGFVRTEIHAASGMPDRIEKDAPLVPIGRPAEPEEIAETIAWLLSDASSYVVGEVLRAAGGR